MRISLGSTMERRKFHSHNTMDPDRQVMSSNGKSDQLKATETKNRFIN